MAIKMAVCVCVAVELTAEFEQQQVVVRHLGKKCSAAGGRELLQGDTVRLGNGDALWLLQDKYKHVVKFCDMNSSGNELANVATGRKRCAGDAGISVESPSKRRSSASSSNSDRPNVDGCDNEQDSDTEHVERVCCYLVLLYRQTDNSLPCCDVFEIYHVNMSHR